MVHIEQCFLQPKPGNKENDSGLNGTLFSGATDLRCAFCRLICPEAPLFGQLFREIVIRYLLPFPVVILFLLSDSDGLQGPPLSTSSLHIQTSRALVFQRTLLSFWFEIRYRSALPGRVSYPFERTASLAHVLQDETSREIDTIRQ